MAWLWLLPALAALLLLPVTVQIDVVYDGRLAAAFTVRCAFIKVVKKPDLAKTAAQARSSSRWRRALPLLRDRRLRHLEAGHVRIVSLDALVLLHAGDASSTALLSGGLDALGRIPSVRRRNVRIRIAPDFFRGRTVGQGQCIIRAKLGIMMLIIITAALVQRREERTWSIPSAN